MHPILKLVGYNETSVWMLGDFLDPQCSGVLPVVSYLFHGLSGASSRIACYPIFIFLTFSAVFGLSGDVSPAYLKSTVLGSPSTEMWVSFSVLYDLMIGYSSSYFETSMSGHAPLLSVLAEAKAEDVSVS